MLNKDIYVTISQIVQNAIGFDNEAFSVDYRIFYEKPRNYANYAAYLYQQIMKSSFVSK